MPQGCFTCCRPEIQATVRQPAVKNFRIAVTLYYIFAMSLWIVIAVIGYWYNLCLHKRVMHLTLWMLLCGSAKPCAFAWRCWCWTRYCYHFGIHV